MLGEHSPLTVNQDISDPILISFHLSPFATQATKDLIEHGKLPGEQCREEFKQLDQYLDFELLRRVSDKTWTEVQFADRFLWLHQQQQVTNSQFTVDNLSRHGQLKTIQWLRASGSTWTFDAANWAAHNGHLEVLQWIRANGGEWTSNAADLAARNGHLEVLQWIRANGGEWTHDAADNAAKNGHLEVLQWIRANSGEWTCDAADWAAQNGHLEVLRWIRENGGEWTYYAANLAACNGHSETLQWIRANGGEWTDNAADWAASKGHLGNVTVDPSKWRQVDILCR